jgi:hypothetical protein
MKCTSRRQVPSKKAGWRVLVEEAARIRTSPDRVTLVLATRDARFTILSRRPISHR